MGFTLMILTTEANVNTRDKFVPESSLYVNMHDDIVQVCVLLTHFLLHFCFWQNILVTKTKLYFQSSVVSYIWSKH